MYSVEYHTTHASTILLTRVGVARPLRPELPDGEPFVRADTFDLEPVPEVPRRHRQPLRPPLAELLGTLPPDEAIARAYRDYDYCRREIAGALDCHSSTASRRLRAFEKRRVS